MKLGIMQPYFFPYIGYWQLIHAVDTFVIYDDVNFIKGGWINRNFILLNGQPKRISLKLHGSSPNKLINEIEIFNNDIDNKKILKMVENAYQKAPFFDNIYNIFIDILEFKEKNLAKYIENSILHIINYFGLKRKIVVSSDIDKDNYLMGKYKVMEICKKLNASEYYNSIGGVKLYDKKEFSSHGFTLKFIDTKNIFYKQFDNDFIPNLSILDAMMFNSKEQILQLLNKYSLL